MKFVIVDHNHEKYVQRITRTEVVLGENAKVFPSEEAAKAAFAQVRNIQSELAPGLSIFCIQGFTKSQVRKFPIVRGTQQCPTGHYRNMIFSVPTHFEPHSTFENVKFRETAKFSHSCRFYSGVEFRCPIFCDTDVEFNSPVDIPKYSDIGPCSYICGLSTFGIYCSIGAAGLIGDDCSFDDFCGFGGVSFGDRVHIGSEAHFFGCNTFGEDCVVESNLKLISPILYTCEGFGDDTIVGISTDKGLWIRSGNFIGPAHKFKTLIKRHLPEYQAALQLMVARHNRAKRETK